MINDVVQVRCSRVDIEQLKASTIWRDIVDELESWKQGFDNELHSLVDIIAKDHTGTAEVLTHLGEINGCLKTVDYLINLPDQLKEILDSREKDKEK